MLNITYEFTKDTELIKQYLKLRKEIFNTSEVTKKILGDKDQEYLIADLETHLLIAKNQNNECVGGVLIYVKRIGCKTLLPMESNEFNLTKILPHYKLDSINYCQVGHYVIHPQYRAKNLLTDMLSLGYSTLVKWNIKFVFALSTIIYCRRYIQSTIATKLPMEANILREVNIPAQPQFNGYTRHLIAVNLQKHTKTSQEKLVA